MVGRDDEWYDPPKEARQASERRGSIFVGILLLAIALALLVPVLGRFATPDAPRSVSGALVDVRTWKARPRDFLDQSAVLVVRSEPAGELVEARLEELRKLWRITGSTAGLGEAKAGDAVQMQVAKAGDELVILALEIGGRTIARVDQVQAARREGTRNSIVLGAGVLVVAGAVVAAGYRRRRRARDPGA